MGHELLPAHSGNLTLGGSPNTSQVFYFRWNQSKGLLIFDNTSSLNVTLEVQFFDGGDWQPWPCQDEKLGIPYGLSETITCTDTKILGFNAVGIWAVRVSRSGGSGTVWCTGAPYAHVPLSPGVYPYSLGKQEDSAHASGDVGIMMLAVRADTPGAIGSHDGDYVPPTVDAGGNIRTTNPSVDVTNEVAKMAETTTPGTLISGADGAVFTGVGVLRTLILTNGSGSATTANIYDNTSATGTKLTPVIALPANTTIQLELRVPFSLGVYVDWATATSCEANGYMQAVA